MEKFVEFRNEGRTIVLVTHDLDSVENMCDRADLADARRGHRRGRPGELVEAYTETMLGDRNRGVDGSVRRGSGEIQIDRGRDVRRRPKARASSGSAPATTSASACTTAAEKSIPRPVVRVRDRAASVARRSPRRAPATSA